MSRSIEHNGFLLLAGWLDRAAQEALAGQLRTAIAAAPLYRPVMPRSGAAFSVRMTNMGPLGWVSDRQGYRYQELHPVTGRAWPVIPDSLIDLWHKVAGYDHPPQAGLVNYYDPGARMGLHRDTDEDARDAPVVSVSLGDTAVFRLGGPGRRDKTTSVKLCSGDVMVLGGAARHYYHGISRVLGGSSTLLGETAIAKDITTGRINITLRRVTRA